MSKIFIVDDDPFISRMYERVLRGANHSVEIAHNGEEAIDLLTSTEELPDLIAVDVVMPKMNGTDLIKKIRNMEKYNKIPIVIITNSVRSDSQKEFLDLGVSLFLIKMDNSPSDIVNKFEQIIKENK